MGKIKEFCQKHKKGLYITGGLVGGAILLFLTQGKSKDEERTMLDITGKEVITWTPGGGKINLEEAKEIMDLNANSSAMYAIFREGTEPDAYDLIELNGTELITKSNPEEA